MKDLRSSNAWHLFAIVCIEAVTPQILIAQLLKWHPFPARCSFDSYRSRTVVMTGSMVQDLTYRKLKLHRAALQNSEVRRHHSSEIITISAITTFRKATITPLQSK